MSNTETESAPSSGSRSIIVLRWVVGIIALAAIVLVVLFGVAYTASPAPIRQPVSTHFHFRLQLIVDSKPVDFSASAFQTPDVKNICSVALTTEPIHFHDSVDQFVHIHWDSMTGGLFFKNYGWSFIGGLPDTLGYRFDKGLLHITRVPIHGHALPTAKAGDHYYVYSGDAASYQTRTWNDFLNDKFETFFGKTVAQSAMPGMDMGDDTQAATDGTNGQEKLAELNHVLGNVVIFVQSAPPTAAQIKDRFNHLIPLPESVCAS